MKPTRPLIGITVDNQANTAGSGTYESAIAYSRAVTEAGGLPVLLPHEPEQAPAYAARCAGVLLTGGVDPDTTAFDQPLHNQARPMDPRRQAFELALLDAVSGRPQTAVLGVCLGMQLMALHAGGTLDQFMPDTLGQDATATHQDNRTHPVVPTPPDRSPGEPLGAATGSVVSSHRQRVLDPGSLRVIATAPDGTIEAIDDPDRVFYVGVQWHPERSNTPPKVLPAQPKASPAPPLGGQDPLNHGLIRRLVGAARGDL